MTINKQPTKRSAGVGVIAGAGRAWVFSTSSAPSARLAILFFWPRNELLSNRRTRMDKPLSSFGLILIKQIATEIEDAQHSRVTDQIAVIVNVAGTTADRRR